jgi:hypothetical protein
VQKERGKEEKTLGLHYSHKLEGLQQRLRKYVLPNKSLIQIKKRTRTNGAHVIKQQAYNSLNSHNTSAIYKKTKNVFSAS